MEIITQCCVCLKIKQEDGTFKDEGHKKPIKASHTYCPDCYKAVREKYFKTATIFPPLLNEGQK